MKTAPEKKVIKRIAPRNPTEAAITCRPYTSRTVRASDGVMRNFSNGGSYIETTDRYRSGTILVMRMIRYPAMPPSIAAEERPRSICLAEVKWQQELSGKTASRFGMGLRYLE